MSEGGTGRGCARCQGTGFVQVLAGDREYARRCACAGAPAAEDPDRDPLHGLGVAPRHRECTLGNFVPRTPALRAAYGRALAYCERFTPRLAADGLGLLFWGPRGTGKTHLAVAILAELGSNHGVRGRFCAFGPLLDEIARSYDRGSQTSQSRVLEKVLAAELLVLDDLACRRMTDWAGDTLFAIVNARYLARRPTLITTAYEDVDPETAREADARRRQEFLVERVGRRLRSRLLEMCVFVPTSDAAEREKERRPSPPSTLGGMRRSSEGSRSSR